GKMLPAFALLLPPLLFLARALDPRTGLAYADWSLVDYPYYRFARETLDREGRLPFWNPHLFLGMPYLASLGAFILYPTELISLCFPVHRATFSALDTILHLWWAGAGTYVLLRLAGRRRLSAFTGGLSFELGQHLFGLTACGIRWIREIAWLPWLFICLERYRTRGGRRWPVLAGVALALPVFNVGVQYAVFAWTAAAGWSASSTRASRAERIGALALLTGACAAVSAVMWIPGAEYFPLSVRSRTELYAWAFKDQWVLQPAELLAFVVPDLFGHGGAAFFGPQPLPTSSDYFGLAPCVLAVAGLAYHARSDARFAVMALCAFVLALGRNTPVGVLLAGLPVLGGFRAASRWLMLVQLSGAWFVARACDDLPARRTAARCGAALLLVLAVCSWSAASRAPALAARL
ncbi:MAG: hypothetical protein AAB368_00060, partial [bacterium]